MTKRASGAAPVSVKPTRSIDLLCAAMLLTGLAMVVQGLTTLGSTGAFSKIIHDNIVKSHKDKVPEDIAKQVASQLHSFRATTIVQALLFLVILLLMAYMIRRARTASAARWATVVVLILSRAPFGIIPQSGLPAAYEAVTVFMGLAGLATLLLLFLPSSSVYFRACRAATMPAGAAARPGGLGSLFGPRRPAPARTSTPAPAAAAAGPEPSAGVVPARPPSRAKAKVRSDAEAIARGAELARTRAKASKTRRAD